MTYNTYFLRHSLGRSDMMKHEVVGWSVCKWWTNSRKCSTVYVTFSDVDQRYSVNNVEVRRVMRVRWVNVLLCFEMSINLQAGDIMQHHSAWEGGTLSLMSCMHWSESAGEGTSSRAMGEVAVVDDGTVLSPRYTEGSDEDIHEHDKIK